MPSASIDFRLVKRLFLQGLLFSASFVLRPWVEIWNSCIHGGRTALQEHCRVDAAAALGKKKAPCFAAVEPQQHFHLRYG